MLKYFNDRQNEYIAGLSILALISIVARIAALLICKVILTNDSKDYLTQAWQLAHLDFSSYHAFYPPGYAAFLLLCGANNVVVGVVQSLIGILTSLLLFHILFRETGDVKVSFALGLANSLSFNQLLPEHVLASETLARFSVVASLWQFQRMLRSAGTHYVPAAILALIVSWSVLIRANLLLIVPVYAIALATCLPGERKPARAMLTYLLLVSIVLIALCTFNFFTVGVFGLTTTLGLVLLANHAEMVRWAPDHFAYFRDVFVPLWKESDGHEPSGVTWQAYKIIQQRTGMSIVQLSSNVTAMFAEIIAAHPGEYFKDVLIGWFSFFCPLSEWHATLCRCPSEWLKQLVRLWFKAQAWINYPIVFGFGAAAFTSVWLRKGRLQGADLRCDYVALAIVLSQSLGLASFCTFECSRYALPIQPLILFVLVDIAYKIFHSYRQPKSKSAQQAS